MAWNSRSRETRRRGRHVKAPDKRSERNRLLRTRPKAKMQKGEFVDLPVKPRDRYYWMED